VCHVRKFVKTCGASLPVPRYPFVLRYPGKFRGLSAWLIAGNHVCKKDAVPASAAADTGLTVRARAREQRYLPPSSTKAVGLPVRTLR
jgi:hypothetical protein